MLLLNFSHPITEGQAAQIETLLGSDISAVIEVPFHFDPDAALESQLTAVIEALPLTSKQWQNEPLLINPPGFAPAALLLMAYLHGRIGYLPPIIRLRSQPNRLPVQFEVAEIINLHQIREQARTTRTHQL